MGGRLLRLKEGLASADPILFFGIELKSSRSGRDGCLVGLLEAEGISRLILEGADVVRSR